MSQVFLGVPNCFSNYSFSLPTSVSGRPPTPDDLAYLGELSDRGRSLELLWQPPGAPSSRERLGWYLAPAPDPSPHGCCFWFRTPGPAGFLLGSDFSVWGGGHPMLVPAGAGDAGASLAPEWLDRALSEVQGTAGQSRSSLGWAPSPREDWRMRKPDRAGRVRVPGQTPGPSTPRETILGSLALCHHHCRHTHRKKHRQQVSAEDRGRPGGVSWVPVAPAV